MHVASHDLFNMKLRTCLDTGMWMSRLWETFTVSMRQEVPDDR